MQFSKRFFAGFGITLIALGILIIGYVMFTFFTLSTHPTSQRLVVQTHPTESISPFININRIPTVPTSLLPTPPPQLPEAKTLSGGVQVFQTFNNCGPAALSMLLSHYDQRVGQQELGQQLRPYQNPKGDNDDKSVTLAELAALAEKYGYVAYRRPAGDIQLLRQFIAADIPVITRTWLRPNEDIGHFRVIKGYDDQKQILIQDDSLQGANLQYSYADFHELWKAFNYEFLIIVPKAKQRVAESILADRLDERSAWQRAVNLSEEVLAVHPDDFYAQFNKSVALYYLHNYQGSIDAFERIESRLPARMLWYQLEPILSYYYMGNFPKVLLMTEHILNNHNRAYSELYYLRGKIFEQQGDPRAATEEFQKANQYNSTNIWKVNLGPIAS